MTLSIDAFRWIVLVEGCFVLGTILAMYERAWRYAVPVMASRGVMLAGVVTIIGYMVGLRDRLGSMPFSWRDALSAFAFTLYIVSLVTLYAWYRRPEGRKRRHEAIAAYNAARLIRAAELQPRAEERAAHGD